MLTIVYTVPFGRPSSNLRGLAVGTSFSNSETWTGGAGAQDLEECNIDWSDFMMSSRWQNFAWLSWASCFLTWFAYQPCEGGARDSWRTCISFQHNMGIVWWTLINSMEPEWTRQAFKQFLNCIFQTIRCRKSEASYACRVLGNGAADTGPMAGICPEGFRQIAPTVLSGHLFLRGF